MYYLITLRNINLYQIKSKHVSEINEMCDYYNVFIYSQLFNE